MPGLPHGLFQPLKTEVRAMLVLSRKYQESVVVGGALGFERLLKVTVLEINGASVRLGFEGDSDIPIHRLEVWERILAENGTGRATRGRPRPARDGPQNKQVIE
jgi:carbon storage regulator CsrA